MATVSDQARPASKDQVKTGYLVSSPGSPVFFAISAVYNFLWTRFTILQTPDTWYRQVQCYLVYGYPGHSIWRDQVQMLRLYRDGLNRALQ
jgi:hypothetical protein